MKCYEVTFLYIRDTQAALALSPIICDPIKYCSISKELVKFIITIDAAEMIAVSLVTLLPGMKYVNIRPRKYGLINLQQDIFRNEGFIGYDKDCFYKNKQFCNKRLRKYMFFDTKKKPTTIF